MKATTITRTVIALVVVVFAVGCGTSSYNTGAVPPVERRVVIVPGHPYGYGGYYGTNRYRRPPVYYRQQYPSRRTPIIVRERPRVIRQRPQYRSNEKRYTPARPVSPQNNSRYTQPKKPQQNNQRPARVYRPNRGQ